ncbi:membrane protein [Candidatus Mancarchaeum acidiphilum]|uniref:Membrane protein n=1 Tax=Candidatus Mancarchaeum acidiphilum TaxID=1920749 RepID=A0A218NM03_9ARCH|nr:hypothetical protein [Candidatus Mancarchaeum acidiphilum]ASI13494.1 membrane protein [Candidatus Mancarchaeum acidiphilum]
MYKHLTIFIAAVIFALLLAGNANAGYSVVHLNTTVILNTSNTAQVNEVLTVYVSNYSVKQYETDRDALNLSLSTWQGLIGPELTQHILNSHSGVYGFKFLPGPLVPTDYGGGYANLYMTYYVKGVQLSDRVAPRVIRYTFNDSVFNFGHSLSGEYLYPNTTLTIIPPSGAKIVSIYPLPDSPSTGFSDNYKNVTEFSWYDQEPLSKFTFQYDLDTSLGFEINEFLYNTYNSKSLPIYLAIVIIVVVVLGVLLALRKLR